jgi:hypothetical protein
MENKLDAKNKAKARKTVAFHVIWQILKNEKRSNKVLHLGFKFTRN